MSELQKEIDEKNKAIEKHEKAVEDLRYGISLLRDMREIETSELYNGFIDTLDVNIEMRQYRNNFYGHTQGETKSHYSLKTAFVNCEDIYFTKDQKEIIFDYFQNTKGVKRMYINGSYFK